MIYPIHQEISCLALGASYLHSDEARGDCSAVQLQEIGVLLYESMAFGVAC